MSFIPGNVFIINSQAWRSSIATNTGIPYTFTDSSNFVHNCKTRHKVIVAANNVCFTFANYVLSQQFELVVAGVNSFYDFFLRAGVKIAGTFYPLTFNGVRDATVPFGTYITSDPLPVAVPTGLMTVYNRRTAINQTSTQYHVLASHGAAAGVGEGTLSTTNTATDYTTGGVPGGDDPSDTLTITNAAGVITATIGANHGTGYTAPPGILLLDPTGFSTTNTTSPITSGTVSLAGQPTINVNQTANLAVGWLVGGNAAIPVGSTIVSFVAGTSITINNNLTAQIGLGNTIGCAHPTLGSGAGFAATANITGGVLTGTVSSTGRGFNYSTRSIGSLALGGGWGSTTQTYGPALITGVPARKCVNLQFLGHSMTRGVGNNDGLGDENRSFGVTERSFRARYASTNNAYSGNELTSIKSNLNYAITYAMVKSVTLPTHVYVSNAMNDFAAGFTLAQVQGFITSIVQREQAQGKKVITETHPPRTTSTDGFITTANQTPIVTTPAGAFTAGGIVDQYDTWLLAGGSGADYVVDVRPFTRDATLTDRWNVTFGKSTSDGVNPLQCDRIALAMASSMPVLTV